MKTHRSMRFKIISPSAAITNSKILHQMTKKVTENTKKSKTRLIMTGQVPITGEEQWNYKRHYKKVGDRTTRASVYLEQENRPKNLQEEPGVVEESSR